MAKNLLLWLVIFFMRQMQGGAGGRGADVFGKSKARCSEKIRSR
jgi:cell division protease FtsH